MTACTGEITVEFDEELHHDNGLSVAQPTSFEARKTKNGFIFTEGGALRSPRSVSVQKTMSRPELTNTEQRRLGESVAYYSVTDLGSGSGGNEYELKAAKTAGDAWIVVTAFSQVEGPAPDFLTAWAVFDRAHLH